MISNSDKDMTKTADNAAENTASGSDGLNVSTDPIIKWGYKTPLESIDWLWQPFIPYSKVSIVQGDGGDRKTTMILDIAARLSVGIQPPALIDGELHYSDEKVEPVTTFYLTNEDEVADSSLVRFKRAGGDDHRFAYSGEMEHHMTLTEPELLSAIHQTGAKLVIIDPYQAFLPRGISLNSVNQMRRVFTALSNVAKETGAAVVLVGHLNKNENAKDIHRGLGSVDTENSARSVITVFSKKHDNKNRFMRATKSNFDEGDMKTVIHIAMDKEKQISYEVDHSEDEKDVPDSKPTDTDRAMEILKIMLAGGPVPVAIIHDVMGDYRISDKTAQRAKSRIGAEVIRIDGKPAWKLQ